MRRIFVMCLVLSIASLALAGAPAAPSPGRVTPQRLAFLVVSDATVPACETLADRVIRDLRQRKSERDWSDQKLPILQYHWNKPAERRYCVSMLHIKGGHELPFIGVVVLAAKDVPQRWIASRRGFDDPDAITAWAMRAATHYYSIATISTHSNVWMGVVMRNVNKSGTERVPMDAHVLVLDVVRGSPAARAGIRRGDYVLEADGTPIYDVKPFTDSLKFYSAGHVVALKLFRYHQGVLLVPVRLEKVPKI